MAIWDRYLGSWLSLSSQENGAVVVPLLLAGTLAVGALLYGAYSNDLLSSLDEYRQYAHDVASDNPENADPEGLHNALDATKDTLSPSKPWTNPFDLNSWMEYLLYSEVTDLVEQNLDSPTPAHGGRGQPGQTVACGLSVEPGRAAPGDYVTVTVTVPAPFKSRTVGVTGSAGGEGFSLPASGGSRVFRVPEGACAQSIPVSFEAYGPEGRVSSGSTSVLVDFSRLPDTDGDGVPDQCDLDDDNDGSEDSSDCAPFDPDRFPGNEEVCGDGIDQDCDGEEAACEPAACVPPACCPQYPQVCGSMCIPSGADCCSGGGWCSSGSHCCSGHCCPDGAECCGSGCCKPGSVCCPGATSCCPSQEQCCGSGCCPAGYICRGGTQCVKAE